MNATPSYLRVVAMLDADPSDARCLDAAFTAARRTGAQMLAVLPDISPLVRLSWMAGVDGAVTTGLAELLEQAGRERIRTARKAFDHACITTRIASSDERVAFQEVRDFSISGAMSAAYSAADLVVCARPNEPTPEWNEAFQSTLIGGRIPCIMAGEMPILSGRLTLAWDGGGPARRALHAALPLIRSVGEVVILYAPEVLSERQRDIAAPEELGVLLRRQGIAAMVQTVAGVAKDGEGLLDAARGLNASLFVCGAYGHTRAQEFFFGGATRSFLAAADGPSLFMAH